jgi:hypothetical protein
VKILLTQFTIPLCFRGYSPNLELLTAYPELAGIFSGRNVNKPRLEKITAKK